MSSSVIVTILLLCLAALVLALAAWAGRRMHNALDFVLASRRLGAWFVALSHAVSATNAWMLTLVAATAFVYGAAAVWLCAAFVAGCLVNVWFIAPRLRAASVGQGGLTLIQIFAADAGDRLQPLVVRSAVVIAMVSLFLQIAAVLQLGAGMLAQHLGFDPGLVMAAAITTAVVLVFTGGLRAASAIDVMQAVVILGLAAFLLLPGLVATGGREGLQAGFAALGPPATDWFAGKRGVAAVALAAGMFGFGLAVWGQPQAAVRFMAAKDEATLRIVRWIAPAWVALVTAAVLLCGWCARVLYDGLEHPEQALVAIATRLLPPWLSGIVVLVLASAIIGGIASQLLAIAASLVSDLKRSTASLSLGWLRASVVAAGLLAGCVALYASRGMLDHGVFAVTALGASFGPLLLVKMSGKRVRPGSMLGALWAGFALSLFFHLLPDSPGDFLERVLPFTSALGIALTGGERRRNPDRADRSQETVHDRVPI